MKVLALILAVAVSATFASPVAQPRAVDLEAIKAEAEAIKAVFEDAANQLIEILKQHAGNVVEDAIGTITGAIEEAKALFEEIKSKIEANDVGLGDLISWAERGYSLYSDTRAALEGLLTNIEPEVVEQLKALAEEAGTKIAKHIENIFKIFFSVGKSASPRAIDFDAIKAEGEAIKAVFEDAAKQLIEVLKEHAGNVFENAVEIITGVIEDAKALFEEIKTKIEANDVGLGDLISWVERGYNLYSDTREALEGLLTNIEPEILDALQNIAKDAGTKIGKHIENIFKIFFTISK